MTFDVAELPGRAQQLVEIQRRFAISHQGGRAGYVGPALAPSKDLATIYDDFLQLPNPDDYGAYTDALLTAMERVAPDAFAGSKDAGAPATLINANTDLAEVSAAGTELDNWTGEAAKTFNENYASKFDATMSDQFSAYWVLRNAVNAEAAVWQQARIDLDKLSADAISQFKQVGACSKASWTALLTVLGSVVSLAGVIPAEGAAISGRAAVGAGVSVASTGMGLFGAAGAVDEFGLGHGSFHEMVDELRRALDKIKTHIHDSEQMIVDALNAANAAIEANPRFSLPAPALVSLPEDQLSTETGAGTY